MEKVASGGLIEERAVQTRLAPCRRGDAPAPLALRGLELPLLGAVFGAGRRHDCARKRRPGLGWAALGWGWMMFQEQGDAGAISNLLRPEAQEMMSRAVPNFAARYARVRKMVLCLILRTAQDILQITVHLPCLRNSSVACLVYRRAHATLFEL